MYHYLKLQKPYCLEKGTLLYPKIFQLLYTAYINTKAIFKQVKAVQESKSNDKDEAETKCKEREETDDEEEEDEEDEEDEEEEEEGDEEGEEEANDFTTQEQDMTTINIDYEHPDKNYWVGNFSEKR